MLPVYLRTMRWNTFKNTLVIVILSFFVSCKHTKKELVAVQKDKPKTAVQKPASTKPGGKQSGVGSVSVQEELQAKLGITKEQIKKSPLYSFILDWYGTPYQYGGCQKSGIDCSCFTNILYDEVYHKKIPRSSSDLYAQCYKIAPEDAKEGDLFFFKINGTSISHVGVFLKKNYFIHSSTSKGVIINSIDEAYYKKYFFCAGKIKEA